jgi:hypothetical protein
MAHSRLSSFSDRYHSTRGDRKRACVENEPYSMV